MPEIVEVSISHCSPSNIDDAPSPRMQSCPGFELCRNLHYTNVLEYNKEEYGLTFRLPPVIVTFTKRRVYVILFFARPLGVFFLRFLSMLVFLLHIMMRTSLEAQPRFGGVLATVSSLEEELRILWWGRVEIAGRGVRNDLLV